MSTKRELIDSLRNKLRERTADSTYTNQFLYQTLIEQSTWLILREASAGRIWNSSFLFQSYTVRMVEVSVVPKCIPVKTGCKIFRSAQKLPAVWEDGKWAIIKSVSSIDGSTDFFYTTSTTLISKKKDPYRKKIDKKYCYYEDGYLWIPEHNPHYVSVMSYFVDDISLVTDECIDCDDKEDCVRFLDTPFTAPHWVQAELLTKALEILIGTKRLQEDDEINKNTTK